MIDDPAPNLHVIDVRDSDWRSASGLSGSVAAGDVVVASSDTLTREAMGRVDVRADVFVSTQSGNRRTLRNQVDRAVDVESFGSKVLLWGSAAAVVGMRSFERALEGDVSIAARAEADRWRTSRSSVRDALGVDDGSLLVGFGSTGTVDMGRVARGLGILRISGRDCIGMVYEDAVSGIAARGHLRAVRFGEDHEHPWRLESVSGPIGSVYTGLDLLVWLDGNQGESTELSDACIELARELGVRVVVEESLEPANREGEGIRASALSPSMTLASAIESAALEIESDRTQVVQGAASG